jgi:hypothetical protein
MTMLKVSEPTSAGTQIVMVDEIAPPIRELLVTLRKFVPGASLGMLVALLVVRALDRQEGGE